MKAFYIITSMVLSFCISSSWAQDSEVDLNDPNVRIEYKKYESFDLGNLEIEGKIIAPGDLSVQERERRRFSRDLFQRDNFDPEVREDIKHMR